MRTMTIKSLFYILALCSISYLVSSCKLDLTDGDSFTGGLSQRKQGATSSIKNDDAKSTNKVIVKGKYLFRVSLSPIESADSNNPNQKCKSTDTTMAPTINNLSDASKGCLCVGAVYLHIKEDFSIDFPDSKAKCSLIGDMDLAELLGAMDDGSDREKDAEANDKMLRLKKLGPMRFDPPRPLLVGPIVQDPSDFRGLTETKQYSVQYTDKDKGNAVSNTTGQITVNVLDVGATMSPLFMPDKPFDNILRFEILSSGFANVPKIKGFLFDKVEFTLNSRPIAITTIKMESNPKDFMQAAAKKKDGSPGMGDSKFMQFIASIFIKKIYVRLDATEFRTD